MSCCNDLIPINLGCFTCEDSIVIPVGLAGEYKITLFFRNGSKTVVVNYTTGGTIDLLSLFGDLAAPYEYELLIVDPQGETKKYCFEMKLNIL